MFPCARAWAAAYLRGSAQLRRASSLARELWLEQHGEPGSALSLRTAELPELRKDDVLLDMLAAPVNPSDVNFVEGRYPIKPPLPTVPGFEGVGRVREAGAAVTSLAPGDWVVPRDHRQGTWRSAGVFRAADWHRVPNTIPVEAAAQLLVNPPTALRMLEEFVALAPGDVLVQNGANSAVGQYVVQLAAAAGVRTVNVVRDRPGREEVAAQLAALGGTLVTTERGLRGDMEAAGLPPARLALNCVGGSAAAAVAKALAPGGVLVTYGGMSMQPVSIPTSLFIFKGITARGFWLSGSNGGGDDARWATVDRVAALFEAGRLRPNRTETLPLEAYSDAFARYYAGAAGTKLLFAPNPHLLQPAER